MGQIEGFCGIDEEAWGQWVDWRRLEKKKKVTERAAKMQRKMLAKYTPEQQRQIINYSMMNDYQGLFEPKGEGHENTVNGHGQREHQRGLSEVERVRQRRREAGQRQA